MSKATSKSGYQAVPKTNPTPKTSASATTKSTSATTKSTTTAASKSATTKAAASTTTTAAAKGTPTAASATSKTAKPAASTTTTAAAPAPAKGKAKMASASKFSLGRKKQQEKKEEPPAKENKAQKILEEVEETKAVMADNINIMLANQEKLEDLEDSTGKMAQNALQFKKNATEIKKEMRCKNWKLTCIIVSLVVGGILVCACLVIIPFVM
ncbi:vesicle-associated membrane protein 4 [Pelomyxa schiedti]|nr:vesicle-associated membrane protein 4 [Pelomyxa schiedti]